MPPTKQRHRNDKKNRCRNYKAISPDVANALAIVEHAENSKFPTLRCICCEKILTPVGGSDLPWYQPEDGIVCDTFGNYGSSVFDSLTREESVRFFVCDKCLVKKARHAFVFQLGKRGVHSLEKHLLAETNS